MPEIDLVKIHPDGRVSTSMKCTNCSLCESPELKTNLMEGSGNEDADFMFVGFAPGAEDDSIGESFTGENGRILRQLLSEADIDVSSCFFTNCCKCSPYEQTIRDSHWKACKVHFLREVERIKPKAIVSLGAQALKWLTGFTGVRRLRRHGIPCLYADNLMVFPIEQPLSIKFADGENFYRQRTQIVDDLLWLRNKARTQTLHEADDTPTDYKLAETVQDVREFLAEFSDTNIPICCDLETSDEEYNPFGLCTDGAKLVLVSLSKGPGHGRAIPYQARGVTSLFWWEEDEFKEVHALLKEFVNHPDRRWFGHNFVQFDCRWLYHVFGAEELKIVHETQYSCHLLDEEAGGKGIEDLTLRYTKMPPWKPPSLKTLLKDTPKLAQYGCIDVDATSRVMPKVREQLNDTQLWLHENLQIPLGHELRRASYRGLRVSLENLERLGAKLNKLITDHKTQLYAMECVKVFQLQRDETFNPNAPHHVAWVMEHILKLPKIKETGTGKYSTDKEVLEHYGEEPFCKTLNLYKRASKLESTYYQGIKTKVERYGEYVHPSYPQHVTKTGRLASREPNLFNQVRVDTAMKAGLDEPALMKDIFIASPGNILLQADFSQQELRVLAVYSKDPKLTQIYIDGLDVHAAAAADVYEIPLDEFMKRLEAGDKVIKGYRTDSKSVNFGIVYGKSLESLQLDFVGAARKLARDHGKELTRQEEQEAVHRATNFLQRHQQSFPKVWEWLGEQERIVRTIGVQTTFFGRQRHYYKVNNEAIRQAQNFPIQSTSGDITNFSYVRVAKYLREAGYKAEIVLSVYDSLIFDCPKEEMWDVAEITKAICENLGFDFLGDVPMKVDIEAGPNGEGWGSLRELNLETREIK